MQNVNHKERSNQKNDHQTGDAGHGNQTASLNKTFDLNPGDQVPDDLFSDLNQSEDDEASEVINLLSMVYVVFFFTLTSVWQRIYFYVMHVDTVENEVSCIHLTLNIFFPT